MTEAALADALAAVEHSRPTELSHHGASCCDVAMAWFRAMARAQPSTRIGLAWIADRWRWAPAHWPVFWCVVAASDRIDCGGHAALGRALCDARGVDAVAIQLLERYEATTTESWRAQWTRSGSSLTWTWGPYAYHEVIATHDGEQLHLWDVSSARAVDEPHAGYGGVVALRIVGPNCDTRWSGYAIAPGPWFRFALR